MPLSIWIQERRLLLSGDTMEDTVTYVAEPQRLDAHIANLELLPSWIRGGSCPTTAARS